MPRVTNSIITGSTSIDTAEAMYALIYKVCGQFAQDCSGKFEFFESLDVFIEQDLQVSDTKKCFRFVRSRLENLPFDQIIRECSVIPNLLAKSNDSAWKALIDLEIDQMIRGYL